MPTIALFAAALPSESSSSKSMNVPDVIFSGFVSVLGDFSETRIELTDVAAVAVDSP